LGNGTFALLMLKISQNEPAVSSRLERSQKLHVLELQYMTTPGFPSVDRRVLRTKDK
jgi:hypothetical protein